MPKPKKNVVDRLATIRNHPLRRKILQITEEAHAMGRLVSPVGLSKQLKEPLGTVSYHVGVLRRLDALVPSGGTQRRGAYEHHYAINKYILAEITDAVALDRIAELIEGDVVLESAANGVHWISDLQKIVRSTGRPVEV